jgi:hypothetical protein
MKYLSLPLLLILTACAGGNHIDYLRMREIPSPTIESFTHCYNYGCDKRKTLTLPTETLNKINALFETSSTSIKEEEQRIIKAMQIFEQDIGEITGTKNDKRGTFRLYQDDAKSTQTFQQDCIDESTNTTTYLTLLNNMGYLKFYEPAFPANRQPFLSGAPWWHQTAVMKDKTTGEKYAVDTWFEDNGKAGYIVPLQEWKDGWKPKRD